MGVTVRVVSLGRLHLTRFWSAREVRELPVTDPDPTRGLFSIKHKTHLLVMSSAKSPSLWIGEVVISVRDLLRRPKRTLLVQNASGDPVVAEDGTNGFPYLRPCELTVECVETEFLPAAWPQPEEAHYDMEVYQKHVLMMTRGTRGDVNLSWPSHGHGRTARVDGDVQTELAFRDSCRKTSGLKRG